MKSAIIGVNGYLGKHIFSYLKSKTSSTIVGFDLEQTTLLPIEAYHPLDLKDKNKLDKYEWDYDYIYFFAGLTGTLDSLDNFENYIDVNEKGLLNLLKIIQSKGHKPKMIFPSTRLVYKGSKGVALTEESEKEFKTIYASSKYNGELFLKMHKLYYDLDFSIFRICVPFGNIFDQRFSYGTIGFFLSKALKGENIQLYGNGDLKRTFTYVGDICSQIVTVSLLKESSGQIYNISGFTYSLNEIAQMIAQKYNVQVQYTQWPDGAWKGESGDTIFDSKKIENLLEQKSLLDFNRWISSLTIIQ